METKAKTARIFVVDDERVIASTTALILKQQGFNATAFFSPLDVLRACEAEAPDILLTDLVMPQMSGIDLTKAVRQSCPRCCMILFSGQSATSLEFLEAKNQKNAFGVLTKPVQPSDLIDYINRCVAEKVI